jgi:hypothetical protein
MPTVYPSVGALFIAGVVRTALAAGKLRLTKSLVTISPSTVIGDLTAAEADYDGYVAITTTTFDAPYYDPVNGGATTISGTKLFSYGPVGSPPVTNVVYNWWLEDTGGNLICAGTFDTPIPMTIVGDAVPLNVGLNYGA